MAAAQTILAGDCRQVLVTMPDQSVNCIVTSPPYFGLRDYRVEGQIGRESEPLQFVDTMAGVFAEAWRVLRDDGTLWLNLGDTYAGGGNGGGGSFAKDGIRAALPGSDKNKALRNGRRGVGAGIKTKDLIGIPWRVAFALQAAGWYLRQEIIWSKPNAMPESITDRCTRSHEYIFMLSKRDRYYYDAEAIKEPAVSRKSKWTDNGRDVARGSLRRQAGFGGAYAERIALEGAPTTRNKRSVWTVATHPFRGAHFATFPPDLIRDCILAGCPAGGVVLDPFFGAGTTGLVAHQLGRGYLGIELNPDYIAIAKHRLLIGRILSLHPETALLFSVMA